MADSLEVFTKIDTVLDWAGLTSKIGEIMGSRLGRCAVAFVAMAVLTIIACGSGGGPGPNGKGLCQKTCPKTCSQDSDCSGTSQLCCDYGDGLKSCSTPQACPRFCTDDSKCATDKGEVCCAARLGSDKKTCVQATACPKFCGTDNDCAGSMQAPKCCTILTKPFCTSVQGCPNTCKDNSECNTMAGQVCCTAARDLIKQAYKQDILQGNVSGLCTVAAGCPKQCTQSTDCNTQNGELCCNGFCSRSCVKECDSNNECATDQGQLCCQNKVIASPFY
jgi:hypothetical protein